MKKIPKLMNMVNIQCSINVPLKINEAFEFFINNNVSKYYPSMSKGHKYFTLRQGEKMEIGSIIDCEESAGNQSIKHEYHVSEIINNERIHYYSKPSSIKIKLPWKIIDSKSNSYVYYDFEEDKDKNTIIRLTIGIQFLNKGEKIFSILVSGLEPWKKHSVEEYGRIKRYFVKEYIDKDIIYIYHITKEILMKIITICRSLKFEQDMRSYAEKLELEGNCVLSVIYPTKNKEEYTENEINILEIGHKKKNRYIRCNICCEQKWLYW
ncbi:MAG: hypothetical protein LBK25_03065 [Treponema sp.]|jgi:hypothetical protein|nr:hypothetical protein [Treponema sp.]